MTKGNPCHYGTSWYISQNMDQEEINNLITRYLNNNATSRERERILTWYRNKSNSNVEWRADDVKEEAALKAKIFNEINKQIGPVDRKTPDRKLWYQIAAAAMILCVLSVGFYFYKVNPGVEDQDSQQVQKKIQNDIQPGSEKAVLTLADGSKITLDDASIGDIANQNGIVISKNTEGQLVYTIPDSELQTTGSKLIYNTIETPNGGQYQVNLPDGTRVWLNAASSLKYPTQFTGNERKVELTGEGYFEVAKKVEGNKAGKRVPFMVKTASQTVEVLGTHFNINSYEDENVTKTTLLEGSVRVSLVSSQNSKLATQNSRLLIPGQQSILSPKSFAVENVDVQTVVSWKNGYFVFTDEDLEVSMRQIARWYNVDISYAGNFDNISFGGSISRSKSLSEVIKILELTRKIKFKVEGRRITIMP